MRLNTEKTNLSKTLADTFHMDEDALDKVQDTIQQLVDEIPAIVGLVSTIGTSISDGLKKSKSRVLDMSYDTAKSVQRSVKANPWKAIAIVGTTAFVAGYAISSRRHLH